MKISSLPLGYGLLLTTILATSALAEAPAAVTSFEYYPEHDVGNLHVLVNARRCLEVAWRGRNLLTQGGEIFTRTHNYTDLNGSWNKTGPLALYRMKDTQPEFDMPVRIEPTTNGSLWTWVCDAYTNGYRQVNRALIQSNRISMTSTLTIMTAPESELWFHPVFFPGTFVTYSVGRLDSTITNRTFTLSDTEGHTTGQVYPSASLTNAWYTGNLRSFSVTLQEGPVRVTVRSDNPGVTNTLYANASWASAEGPTRRGLVCHSTCDGPKSAPFQLTQEIILEVGDAQETPPGQPIPVIADFLKLTPALPSGHSNFWLFKPTEVVSCPLLLDNLSSENPRSVQLACNVRDYENRIIHTTNGSALVPARSRATVNLSFGPLARGAYAIEFNAITNSVVVGHTAIRVGVVPDHTNADDTRFLGAYQAFLDNVDQQVDLMKRLGISHARFRTEAHEECWNVFEPAQDHYITNMPSVDAARKATYGGITLIYSGEGFPPQLSSKPSWLGAESIDTFIYRSGGVPDAYFPRDPSLFSKFVQNWAGRFNGKVHYFEVFNEPNTAMKPADAALLLQCVSTNIKAVIPNARIIAADIENVRDPSTTWLGQVLDLASNYVDIVTYHHYPRWNWFKYLRTQRFPTIEDAGWGVGEIPYDDQVRNMAALGRRYGKPVWNGELAWVGYYAELFPSATFQDSERDTANLYARSILLTRANGVDSVLVCYAPSLSSVDWTYNIYPLRAGSFVGWGWMVKPWAVAFSTLSELLDGADFLQRVDLGDPKVYVLCFGGSNQVFAAAWRSSGTAAISNPFQADEVDFRSIVGQSLVLKRSMPLTGAPMYIVSSSLTKEDFVQRLRTARILLLPPSPEDLREIPK
jgi:hypothetical protein